MSTTDTLFKTEGILLKNNLIDVPNKTLGMTNILTEAFGDYKYEDISIINGLNEYGQGVVTADSGIFLGLREYERLAGIELDDLGKPAINGVYTKAAPFQTIKNQLDKIGIQLGESFETGGGDGLLAEYFKWSDVYGDADDIRSAGGGTFVSNQDTYFTPNTAVAPSDSEAFYEFDANDLADKPVMSSEIIWGSGVFSYESRGAFHPTIADGENNNSGIAKFSGYFNPGFFSNGDAGTGAERGSFTTDRILISTESKRYGNSTIGRIARSSIPVIMKFWDVDQTTGEQLTSNNSPLFVARYAPSLDSDNLKFDDDVDGDGKTDGDNPPAYYFAKVGGGGINDQFQSPGDIHGNNVITSFDREINHGAYVIAPIQDGRMTKPETERNKYLNPFKPTTFYRIEMYFILGPRVADKIIDRTVYIEGYNRYNARPQTLHKSHFWSENPLNSSKYKAGKISEKIKFGISRFGTNVGGNATRLGSVDFTKNVNDPDRYNTPSFKSHKQSIGLDSPADVLDVTSDYKRLFSDKRLLITYKPPHCWNEIRRGTFAAPNFGPQSEAETNENFHKYHYVAWSLPKTTPAGVEQASNNPHSNNSNKVLPQVGNLLIDQNSPKPRSVRGGSSGSVFDSFTYISAFDDRGGAGQYAYLTKPVTGIHKKFTGTKTSTDISIIENKGLKGYGCGKIIHLPDGRNKLEIPGLHNLDCPRTFYDGEVFGLRDIIIFEDYNDTPFIQISDTSPMGTYVTMKSSKTQSKPSIDGKEPGFSNPNLESKGLANAHSDNRDLDLGKNFFVYHHRGLVDKSLDEYCILPEGQGLVIEAKAAEDTDVGATVIEVDRNDLSTYAGSRMVVPDSPRNADGTLNDFNVWGKFIDVNGTRVPNGTVINEYHDYKHWPRQLYSKAIDNNSITQKWELRQRGYNCPQATAGTIDSYGSPMPGDVYYQAVDSTNALHDNLRLVFVRTTNRDKFYSAGMWKVSDGGKLRTASFPVNGDNPNGYTLDNLGALITYSSDTNRNQAPAGGPNAAIAPVTSTQSEMTFKTDAALSAQTYITGHDTPNVPVGLSLHDTSSDNYAIQGLTDVVKAGFGVTICSDATKASLKYQCFKPTNTAPPFLATSTGLRTIPEGLTTLNVDNVNSVKISYASPGAGSHVVDATDVANGVGDKIGDFRNAPISRIICTSFHASGNYGNESPGINTVPSATFFHNDKVSQHDGSGNYFQPGGIIKNNDDIIYNRQIEFESITTNGDIQRFHLLATTDPDPDL